MAYGGKGSRGAPDRAKGYSDARMLAICRTELQRAVGFQADEIEANRRAAIEYYLAAPRPDDVEGLSKAQSTDVADMVEASLSFMVPALASESMVQFAAVGADDEEQAAKESRIVQAMLRQGGSNSYVAIQTAVKDALLLRLGILKCWIEETSETERESYPALSGDKNQPDPEVLEVLLQPESRNEVRTVDRQERNRKDSHGVTWSWSVTIKATETRRRLRLAAVDPTEFFWGPELTSLDLERARFLAERQVVTRSDLIEEGYAEELVKGLPKMGVETLEDKRARKRGATQDLVAEDFWQEAVEVHRCYALLGTGEGGRAERWCISIAARSKFLGKYKAKYLPYAAGAAILEGHSLQGLSLYDKLRQVQDTKTGFLRAWLNNAQFVNRPRAAYIENQVNEDDLFNVEIGGGVRVTRQDALQYHQYPDIGPSCVAGLEYQDKMRSERGGASLEMLSPDLQLSSPTAAGTEREMAVKEQLAALMCRNLAETLLRGAYLVAHRLMRAEMSTPVSVQDAGEWVEDEPSEWPVREDVSIVVGMSPGERSRRLTALSQVIAQQEKLLQAGQVGVLVDPKQYHTALTEWARAAGLEAPEKYIMDPMSEQAQQKQKENQRTAEVQARAQADLARQIEVMKGQVKAFETLVETQYKYWSDILKADVEEMKIMGAAAAGLETQRIIGAARSSAAGQAAGETAAGAQALTAQPAPEAGALPPGAIN